ncbi:uncharacterized protein LOC107716443 [Sinocyclocheilus rhinocerous]|uniref:uncharacterized protein LOC107716443 n=1 Tax=Sinocyclocheilus rhinocerous TaxID=307959 RepID=UPI0007B7A508|nr:PREDICTED: uncharacterized protein LOC107716443 [Sinocyclocheilus rhinocerous]
MTEVAGPGSVYVAVKAVCWLGNRQRNRLEADTRDIHRVQQEILLKRLQKHSNTVYGKQYEFTSISDTETFQQRHPITDYDHYEKFVERMAKGEQNVLIPEKPLILAMTSGTSGSSRMLLSTKDTNTELFLQGVTVCLDAMRQAFPATGWLQKTLKLFYSPIFRQSEAGIPIGPNSSTPASSKHMLHLYTTPAPIYQVLNDRDALYLHLLFGLKDHYLGMLESNFSSTVFYAFRALQVLHANDSAKRQGKPSDTPRLTPPSSSCARPSSLRSSSRGTRPSANLGNAPDPAAARPYVTLAAAQPFTAAPPSATLFAARPAGPPSASQPFRPVVPNPVPFPRPPVPASPSKRLAASAPNHSPATRHFQLGARSPSKRLAASAPNHSPATRHFQLGARSPSKRLAALAVKHSPAARHFQLGARNPNKRLTALSVKHSPVPSPLQLSPPSEITILALHRNTNARPTKSRRLGTSPSAMCQDPQPPQTQILSKEPHLQQITGSHASRSTVGDAPDSAAATYTSAASAVEPTPASYRIGDVVKVVGFHNQCPKVEFHYTLRGQMLSVRGEKVSESLFLGALKRAVTQWPGAKLIDCCVESGVLGSASGIAQPHYLVFVELKGVRNLSEEQRYKITATATDSDIYRSFRMKGSIGPMRVQLVCDGTFQELKDRLMAFSSTSSNTFKMQRVIRRREFADFLLQRAFS